VAGRDFDLKKFITDSSAMLLNESAVKHLGLKDPIGQTLKDNGTNFHVVGVVKDFILTSPYQPIEPMFIGGAKGWFSVIHMKLNAKNPTAQNVASLKKVFKKHNPEYELNYRFADEEYEKKFRAEISESMSGHEFLSDVDA